LRRIATKEDGLRLLGFQAGQDGEKVGGLVGGELLADDGQAQLLGFLGELFGYALAKGRAVVDDGDVLTFITLAAYTAMFEPICVSLAMMRNRFL